MSKDLIYKWILIVGAIGLVNLFILKIAYLDMFIIALLIGLTIYLNRDLWRGFSVGKIMSMLGVFILSVLLLASFFYFVARPVVDLIANDSLKYVAIFVIVVGVFIPYMHMLSKVIFKLSKGKLLGTDIKVNPKVFDQSPSEEILDLIDAGKVVPAVKAARVSYGYSLVEAKQYIDHLTEDSVDKHL